METPADATGVSAGVPVGVDAHLTCCVPADQAWAEANPKTAPSSPDMMLDDKQDARYGSVSVLCASICGRLLAGGSEKGLVVVWSLGAAGAAQRVRQHQSTNPGRVVEMAFGDSHPSHDLA